MSVLSQLSETLIGSEIVRLGNEINARITAGEKIYNFTIGDFKPSIFPIPKKLEEEIIKAYQDKFTNYPSGEGILNLRKAISHFINRKLHLEYNTQQIQVASGGRPLIYSVFRAIVDKGDKVIYPTPSWNNNHYTHFNDGEHVMIATTPEHNFMPTPEELAPHIKGASLIALCSPLNPTGTTFKKEQLLAICNLIVEENKTRKPEDKKLYLLYDQIYWTLTHKQTEHFNPVSLVPAMKDYTLFIDGISKCFAATGVRVGWCMGPEKVIAKVKAILSHIGAWAPMAEQVATANYLMMDSEVDGYLANFNKALSDRLFGIHDGIQVLKQDGFSVDSIVPEAAMYLTIKIDLKHKRKEDGELLESQMQVWQYILDEAKIAIVPFSSFGGDKESPWYRLSVGTCALEEIPNVLQALKHALIKLT